MKERPAKRWKEVECKKKHAGITKRCKKNMLDRRIKKTNAQDRSLWRLGSKYQLIPARKKKPGFRSIKTFINT